VGWGGGVAVAWGWSGAGAGSAGCVASARRSGGAAVSGVIARRWYRRGRDALPSGPSPPVRTVLRMSGEPVGLTQGPPETVLPPEPAEALAALDAALAVEPDRRRAVVADVVARWPRFLDAWARLGELARDDVEAYAYFRVGYHRGRDRLRHAGGPR